MSDPAFAEVERQRELNEGVHPPGEDDSVPIQAEHHGSVLLPPWTVCFRSMDKLRSGRFYLRAWSYGEAETLARRRLADDEIILEIKYGLREETVT